MAHSPKRAAVQPRRAGASPRLKSRDVLDQKEEASMEAKVDVRKLQILNDRINQTIEALSQVRFSVHGLGHTGVPKMMNPFGTIPQSFGYPSFPPYYGTPPVPSVFPPVPGVFGLQHTPFIPPIPGMFGLQHTPYTPFVNPLFHVPGPFVAPMNPPIPTPGINPSWGVPPTPWFGGGLLHSTPDPIIEKIFENRVLDPYRILHTFPYLPY
jgi:hypothetical protein